MERGEEIPDEANRVAPNDVEIELAKRREDINDEEKQLVPAEEQNVDVDAENQKKLKADRNKINKKILSTGLDPVNIKKDYQEKEISYEKMIKTIKDYHAKNKEGDFYGCCETCNTSSGWHYCCKTTERSEFDKFGVGVSLYFKFIKYLMGFFIIYTIISLPIIFFSVRSAQKNTDFDFDSYSAYLYSTTLGTIGMDTFKCSYTNMSQSAASSAKVIKFKCHSGILDLDSISVGLAFDPTIKIKEGYFPDRSGDISSLGCAYYDSANLRKSCVDQTRFKDKVLSSCQKPAKECSIEFTDDLLDGQFCSDTELLYFPIYSNTFCQDGQIDIINEKTIAKSTIAFIVACLDAGIILMYLFMIISLRISEKKAIVHILRNSLSPNLFTLEFQNLPRGLKKQELITELWTHAEKNLNSYYERFKKKEKELKFKVVDVKVAETNKLIEMADKKGELIKKRSRTIRTYASKFDVSRSLPNLVNIEHLNSHHEILAENKKNASRKLLNQINSIETKIKSINSEIKKFEKNPQTMFKAAWITFETMKQRDLAYHFYFNTPVEYCCWSACTCCYDEKPKYFKGRMLKCMDAPDPSNILWKNLDISDNSKRVRRLISYLITLFLLACTFVAITVIKIEQQKTIAKYPSYDCSSLAKLEFTMDDVIYEYQQSQKLGYTECYCKKDFVTRVDDEFNVNGEQKKICLEWAQFKTLVLLFPFLIVIVIVIINMIMQGLYRVLSQFEKHKYLSAELASRVTKIFIAQFLNTGVIILLLNIRLRKENRFEVEVQDIVKGKYYDLNPEWFKNVGTVICLTMAINIFSTPIIVLIFHFIRLCKRGCDQSCSCNRRKTKKKKQTLYESLYFGPDWMIDYRYSSVLNIVFVCFLYSPGLPLLYFTTFLQLLLTYWLDKFFLLRICKIPSNIDDKLEDRVRRVLYGIILVHLIFAIWMYGNENIFNQSFIIKYIDDVVKKSQEVLNNYNNIYGSNNYLEIFFKNRFLKSQNVVLDIVLILMLLYFLYTWILFKPLETVSKFCCRKCSKKKFFSVKNKLASRSYYHTLKKREIFNEQRLVKFDLKQEDLNPKLKERLEEKIKDLGEETERRKLKATENEEVAEFMGIFSYDIRHNPNFRQIFAIDEALDAQKSLNASQFSINQAASKIKETKTSKTKHE